MSLRVRAAAGVAVAVVAAGIGWPVMVGHTAVTLPFVQPAPVMTAPAQPPPPTVTPAAAPAAPVTVNPGVITAMVRGRMLRCTLDPGPDDYLCPDPASTTSRG